MKLLLGDCLDKLKELDDNSVDSIVTDPPYGLSFMGKKWDYDVPSTEIWEECIRVLKPGGHLLSFAGSRTYHRMAVRIEDAGFEIRDQIMWIYGSGFPKSMDISKQIDKKFGAEREVIGEYMYPDGKPRNTTMHQTTRNGIYSNIKTNGEPNDRSITAPETDEAKNWEGWGTALKPAHEPIVMARKPLVGTVVDNILEWGTGGINIDGCRIGVDNNDINHRSIDNKNVHTTNFANNGNPRPDKIPEQESQLNSKGRFPANIIFDEEAGRILDEQSGTSKSTGGTNDIIVESKFGQVSNIPQTPFSYGDTGGASRFFYCPKTSKSDRNAGTTNTHPTVKPTDLMSYLIRLVTPKGGIVLDPFMGSGSTGKGAVREGMVFIGIERESEYFEIAEARIQNEIDNVGKPKKASKQKETKVEPIVENKFWE
jgi:site-specific DNA-methyltransferase (adenine-specific)